MKDSTSLGIFKLGDFNVELLTMPRNGGCVYWLGGPGPTPSLHIGLDYEYWPNCLSVLIHEASELIHMVDHQRFAPDHGWGDDHAHYIFHFSHQQFSSNCEKLGWFLEQTLHPLREAYNKHRKSLVDERKRIKKKGKKKEKSKKKRPRRGNYS